MGYSPPLVDRGMIFNVIIWDFPKIRGTLLGVPVIRTIVFWGLYWGSPILGNYYIEPLICPQCRLLTGGGRTQTS